MKWNPALTIRIASATWLLAGCAVQGARFRPAVHREDNAVIYVYRPYSYAGSLIHPAVVCNGRRSEVKPGGYSAFVVAPGKVVCDTATEAADEVEINALPGHSYFIREEIGWGVLIGHPHLDPEDSDRAQTEIQQCCRLQSVDSQSALTEPLSP